MVDTGESTNRFVCPSDRQLALRAKLKTGWSIKTGSIGYQNSGGKPSTYNTALEPDEQAAILDVIHRAEQLDLREQERVGKLIERLENMRRNALGRGPQQCLLCGEKFGLLGAQSVPCAACGRPVCQKCAIEAWLGPKTHQNPQHGKDQWLCKICAETREIWKKSGAWFFKGLPRYILPGRQNRKSVSPPRVSTKDEDSSEEEKGLLGVEQASPNQDTSPGQYSRQTSSSTSSSQRSSSTTSIPHPTMPTTAHQTQADIHSYQIYQLWTQDETINPSPQPPPTCHSPYQGYSMIDRRDSIISRVSTVASTKDEWNWGEDLSSVGSVASLVNIGYNKTPSPSNPSIPPTPSLSLTLSYDAITSTLHLTLHRAKHLPATDINGLADPFCKLSLVPEGKPAGRLRTRTVHKTRNPEFEEALTFYEVSEADLLKKSLLVVVLDDDRFGKDYLGEAKICLAGLRVQKCVNITVNLDRTLPDDCTLGPDTQLPSWFEDPWSRGQILISLCYSTKKRALLVLIVRCANLLPMDNNGFSDPFIKMHLKPDPHHRKHKTSIKWKNLNPYYNEEFPFETRPNELSTQSLYITVWDKDYGKSNDYLGGLILGGVGSKGRRLKHWLDMIRYPDHRHEYWHSLSEDTLTDNN